MPTTQTPLPPTTTAFTRVNALPSFPMTRAAWSALRTELARGDQSPTGRPDRDLVRRLDTIRDVLETATVVGDTGPDAERAVIGRRVTWREPDGATVTASLVIPGDGDPSHGWISVDAPVGAALVGARTGDHVVVHAPAGDRIVSVEAVR